MISMLPDLSMQHSFHNIVRYPYVAAMPYHCALCRLPIMRTGSRSKCKELITERVVGQMFLPGVVGVDRFKTKFEGVGSLANLACLCIIKKPSSQCTKYALAMYHNTLAALKVISSACVYAICNCRV